MFAGAGYEAGASQFNGGGFMPSPGAQGGSASAQKKTFDSASVSIRRLTLKQLCHAIEQSSGDAIVVDGKEISNVAIVGKIVGIREDNITFHVIVDDGTGRITVKSHTNTGGEGEEIERQRRAELREGIYVRVFGGIVSAAGERQINAYSVRPITDHNEVTYHLSQVIFQHLHLAKGGDSIPAGTNPKFDGAAFGAAAPAAAAPGFGAANGMNPIQSEVLSIFNAPAAMVIEAGLTIADVIAHSNNRFNQQQVMGAVTYLVDEGHLYSTIDDAHWKSCAC